MKKILLVDDEESIHLLYREELEEKGLEVHSAMSGEDALRILPTLNPNLVILDINMPGKSGLEALKDMKTRNIKVPVLILSMFSEDHYGLRAIKAGAAGYLKKVSAPTELVSAIRKIVGGGKYISPILAEKLAESVDINNKKALHQNLSDREYQIMCFISFGKSAEEIAEELAISIHTVYSYRNRILEKMHLKSNVELTQYAIQHKLIEI